MVLLWEESASIAGLPRISDRFGLGNLDSKRDWGFAGDYVEAMFLIMQQAVPENFIISTGQTHSIRDFLDVAFSHVGIGDWEKHVYIDPAFKRPAHRANRRCASVFDPGLRYDTRDDFGPLFYDLQNEEHANVH